MSSQQGKHQTTRPDATTCALVCLQFLPPSILQRTAGEDTRPNMFSLPMIAPRPVSVSTLCLEMLQLRCEHFRDPDVRHVSTSD
jgi:hypothetical protein